MKAYICGTDWQHECKDVLNTVSFFNSIEKLKEIKKCWKQCGIVEVEIKEVEVVENSRLPSGVKKT